MVISKFQNSFSALQAILRYPNSFLGTINDSGILHCTQTIKIINYSVIKCQKNGAKMNKIVQKWQFQKIFYTTMETVLGFSQNRLAELFQNYVFSTNQYLYFDLYVAECQIQFFWPASRFGVYVHDCDLIGIDWRSCSDQPSSVKVSWFQYTAQWNFQILFFYVCPFCE